MYCITRVELTGRDSPSFGYGRNDLPDFYLKEKYMFQVERKQRIFDIRCNHTPLRKTLRPDVETVWKNSKFLPWNFTQEPCCILMSIRIPDETFHSQV